MTLQLQHRDDPYHQALEVAFRTEQVKVCYKMNDLVADLHLFASSEDVNEQLATAALIEQMGRHLRRALEQWQQGHYREAMRELSWALAKGGE